MGGRMAGEAQPVSISLRRPRMGQAVYVVERLAWAALLIALPITSFPFFPPAIGGEALVRPLSLYPLIVLLFLVVAPRLLTRPLPKTFIPLVFFVVVAVASSLLSILRGIEPALGISAQARLLRGLSTLAIGCTFYLAIALLPENEADLRFSLRCIYAGGAMALGWGSLQALNLVWSNPTLFYYLEKVQRHISIRPLQIDRIAGLTYEPHWFADQIVLLIVPWTMAAVLTGFSAFHFRWRWLTVEWLLLGWSVLLLPFTYSRSGLFNLVVLVFFAALFFLPRNGNRQILLPKGNTHPEGEKRPQRRSRIYSAFALTRALKAILVLAAVAAPIYLIGTRNTFFARIWEYWRSPDASLEGYLSQIGFDARLVYSQAAYRTYLAYPLLGVGLGNYAFYFEEMLPYRPVYEVPEVLLMITPERGRDRLITAKNFYLRLLAETGIVGAVGFLAFVVAIFGCALYLWLTPEKSRKYWGVASLCGLLAFVLSAMTFDSFVIPNMWVVFGLITAATRVTARPASISV
jgi:O-antigen ligase